MVMTPLDTEYESTSYSYSNEEYEVFSNLSRSGLISFIKELMSRFQDKSRLVKTLKKECDILKEELKISQNKVETFEKDHITLVSKLSDKNLNEHELALQDFIMTGLERTKLASIIYGVSNSKGKGIGYNEKCVKTQLIKTSNINLFKRHSNRAKNVFCACF